MRRQQIFILGLAAMAISPAPAVAATTSRVSLSNTGLQLTSPSEGGTLSADGRHVGFWTPNNNLVAGDSNDNYDAFVRDRTLKKTVLVSVSTSGVQGNGLSASPVLSRLGRFAAFQSLATNFMAGDTNATYDVFVRDRDTDVDGVYDETGAVSTTPVSVSSSGTVGDGRSDSPAVAGGGEYVAFASEATNLVTGDTNGASDVFVRDRTRGRTIRVSVSTGGAQALGASIQPSISRSGRWIAFASDGPNLVAGDTNNTSDVFVRDRDTDADGIFDESGAVRTVRASVANNGAEGNSGAGWSSISANGRHVAFESDAWNLIASDTNSTRDIFVRDLKTARTARVNVSTSGAETGYGSAPSVSFDGRYVAFTSFASNVVSGDTNCETDVFVRDRDTDADGVFDEASSVRTTRANVSSAGVQANGDTWFIARISENGNAIVFGSSASNLVDADTNQTLDIFLRTNP